MAQDEQPSWEYKPDEGTASHDKKQRNTQATPERNHRVQPVLWEAPEYIDHQHGAGWYAALVLGSLALAALVYLVAKDAVASVIIVLVGIIIGIFATQKPQIAKYEISKGGLSINGKIYNLSNYKSFAVIHEGDLMSVNLFPLKRFMPPLSAYFKPTEDEMIINALGNYLPYEDRNLESVERLARRLRL